MSDWFRPATQSLESLAFSARASVADSERHDILTSPLQFQIETLASLVRYYRKKCHQHRTLLDRMKTDSQLLRKSAQGLVSLRQNKPLIFFQEVRGSEDTSCADEGIV